VTSAVPLAPTWRAWRATLILTALVGLGLAAAIAFYPLTGAQLEESGVLLARGAKPGSFHRCPRADNVS